jgi:hypothetical protein
MLPTFVEQMLMGAMVLQTISAAVGSMSKPKREDGWYCWFYKFTHQLTNLVDAAFEKKFNVAMPRVVDETATEIVITPTAHKTTPTESSTPSF